MKVIDGIINRDISLLIEGIEEGEDIFKKSHPPHYESAFELAHSTACVTTLGYNGEEDRRKVYFPNMEALRVILTHKATKNLVSKHNLNEIMHSGISLDDVNIVNFAYEFGADVNYKGEDDYNPFYACIYRKSIKCAKRLIVLGATVDFAKNRISDEISSVFKAINEFQDRGETVPAWTERELNRYIERKDTLRKVINSMKLGGHLPDEEYMEM